MVNIESQVTFAQFCVQSRDQIVITILNEIAKRCISVSEVPWKMAEYVIVIRGMGILSSVKLSESFWRPSNPQINGIRGVFSLGMQTL
jgi:hypothetical protein